MKQLSDMSNEKKQENSEMEIPLEFIDQEPSHLYQKEVYEKLVPDNFPKELVDVQSVSLMVRKQN